MKTLCFPATVRVDNRSFYYYLKPGKHCASNKISELKTVAFRANYKMRTLCFLPTISIDNRSFQSYIQNWKTLCVPSTIEVESCSIYNCLKKLEGAMLPSTIGVDNRSFQGYLKPGRQYASLQLSESTTVDFRATFKKIL